MVVPFPIRALIVLYIAWGAWSWYIDRAVHPADGVLVAEEPLQSAEAAGSSHHEGRWTLTTRAAYKVRARILGVARYRFDALAGLVPEDLALGWGPMSDNRVLNGIEITQNNRFYYWRMKRAQNIARDSVITHSANTHVIPDGRAVAVQLARLRTGQVVTLSGQLVDAVRDDGARITTSLTRNDSGAGACEVLWVHDVSVEP
jgi:hypothetical protein